MQSSAMLFSSSKAGHFGQILSSGFFGELVLNQLTPPDPATIQQWGSMIIQFLVAAVTIWATIRKALQKPETVVKVPVAPPATVTVASGAGADTAAGAAPLLLLAVLLGVTACASHRRAATPVASLPVAVAPGLPAPTADNPLPMALELLTPDPPGRAGRRRPLVGKKGVVNVYLAPVTSSVVGKKAQAATGAAAVLTSIEKPRAAVAAAPDAVASDYRKQGQRGGAAASGAGATATATTSKGISWWWLLVPVVGGLGWLAWRKRASFLA